MARSLMFLFLAGAVITLGSLLLPGAVEGADRMRMAVMGTSALAIAITLFVGFDRLPRWVFPIFLACGTLLIEWTVYASGDTTSPYVMFWFWLAIYSFTSSRAGRRSASSSSSRSPMRRFSRSPATRAARRSCAGP